MNRFLLVLMSVSLLLPAHAFAADPFRSIEPLTTGETVSDGVRYVAWVREPNIRVLDDRSGRVSSFPLPADCNAPTALGAGHVAARCLSGLQLLNVTTGTWTAIPPSAELTAVLDKEQARVQGIGREWLSIAMGSWDAPDVAWVRRSTGRVVAKDPGDLRKYPNLDAAGLWRRLCAPLTRRRNPSRFGPRVIGPQMIGRHGLDFSGNTVLMRRCGTDDLAVITRSWKAREVWFGATRVSWSEPFLSNAVGKRGQNCVEGCIRTYNVKTGRVRSFRGPPGDPVQVVHTRRHIFFDDHEDIVDEVSYRYRVTLPGPG